MDPERKPADAIQFVVPSRKFCVCGLPLPGRMVRIVDMAQLEAGWLAKGEIVVMCPCPTCAEIYSVLVQYIPIECATFPCSKCGTDSRLTPEIMSITASGKGYSFVALIKCDTCSKPRRLSKLLRGLSNITKLKIGPTGVEIEVKS